MHFIYSRYSYRGTVEMKGLEFKMYSARLMHPRCSMNIKFSHVVVSKVSWVVVHS